MATPARAPLLARLSDVEAVASQTAAFAKGVEMHASAVNAHAGWLRTAFTTSGRALHRVAVPWLLLTALSAAWTAAVHYVDVGLRARAPIEGLRAAYAPVATTLGFLLVFRVNRAATRYWDARTYWGKLVERARTLAGAACVHLAHAPDAREDVVRWGTLAFAVASKHFMRNEKCFDERAFAGVLEANEVAALAAADHPPLYAAEEARRACARALQVGRGTPAGLGARRAAALERLETKLDVLIGLTGGMERIANTPLPMVYVAHLRAYLLVALLALIPLFEPDFGWGTVPAVFFVSAALLGIDAAASECESPFTAESTNHLNQDGACLLIFKNVRQIMAQYGTIEASGAIVGAETEDASYPPPSPLQ